MKINFLAFFTVFSLSFFLAQDVKVKRGVVFLENIQVAKIEKNNQGFIFMDLKETPIFSLQFINKKILDTVRDEYIEINRLYNRDIKLEQNFLFISPFTSEEKTAAFTCIKAIKIIDEKGINIKKLDQLFTTLPKRKLDNKLVLAYTIRKELDQLNLKINKVGEILSNGKLVGYFSNLPNSFGSDDFISEKSNLELEIYDANSKLIGKYNSITNQIKTVNGKSFTLYKGILGGFSAFKPPSYLSIVQRVAIMDESFARVHKNTKN